MYFLLHRIMRLKGIALFSFLKTISLCCSICSRILLFKSDSLITFWTLYWLIVLYLETYRSQTTGSVIPALQHLFVVLSWFLCCFWLFSDIGLLYIYFFIFCFIFTRILFPKSSCYRRKCPCCVPTKESKNEFNTLWYWNEFLCNCIINIKYLYHTSQK